MDSLLSLLGLLFFLLLVIAAAVEMILDTFKGTLSRFGFTRLEGKVSLEEALALSEEFASGRDNLASKLETIAASAEQLKDEFKEDIETVREKYKEIKSILEEENVDLSGFEIRLGQLASSVKALIEQSEQRRIFYIRLLAAVIGCLLVWASEFYVLDILYKAQPEVFGELSRFNNSFVNILLGGVAAASGSSYWHDQLRKVRNLKDASSNIRSLGEKLQ